MGPARAWNTMPQPGRRREGGKKEDRTSSISGPRQERGGCGSSEALREWKSAPPDKRQDVGPAIPGGAGLYWQRKRSRKMRPLLLCLLGGKATSKKRRQSSAWEEIKEKPRNKKFVIEGGRRAKFRRPKGGEKKRTWF